MKKQNLYNVTVVGSFTKDILVCAEDEDAALDLAQSICDNTDLITFNGDEPLDIFAEDAELLEPTAEDEETEECNCNGGCGFCGELRDHHGCAPQHGKGWPCYVPSSAGEPMPEHVRLAAAVVLDHLLNAKDD